MSAYLRPTVDEKRESQRNCDETHAFILPAWNGWAAHGPEGTFPRVVEFEEDQRRFPKANGVHQQVAARPLLNTRNKILE